MLFSPWVFSASLKISLYRSIPIMHLWILTILTKVTRWALPDTTTHFCMGFFCPKWDNTNPWTAPNRLNLMKCKTVFVELEQLKIGFNTPRLMCQKMTISHFKLASKDTLFGVHHIEWSLRSNTNFLPTISVFPWWERSECNPNMSLKLQLSMVLSQEIFEQEWILIK